MRRAIRTEVGFTMVELLMTCSVLAIGACGLAAVLVQSMTLSTVNAETSDAQATARQVIERLSRVPASKIFAAYNGATTDDPVAVAETPGDTFTLSRKGGTGTVTATLTFPCGSDPSTLREDVEIPELGMPRDLNGDGEIDSEDHSSDYRLLPVLIRVRWKGVNGIRTWEMATAIANPKRELEFTEGVVLDESGGVPLGASEGTATNALEALLEDLYR